MSSWGDMIRLKVTGFDKTEEEIKKTVFRIPEISYECSYEEYYPQQLFSWDEEKIEMKSSKTTTVFITQHYLLLNALMPNLERILVDGQCAPYETLFTGHYLGGYTPTTSYIIKEIDNETGNVLYENKVDTIPNIVHDVQKYEEEHQGEVKYISNKEELLELMEENKRIYEFADPSLKEDEELAFMAVEKCGDNYKHLLDKYKNQRKFQLTAVISSPMQFHYIPQELLKDFDFLIEACRENKYCFSYVEDETLKKKIEEALPELVEPKPQAFKGFSF